MNAAIKTFAREILTCGCEEEVFNTIDHQSGVPILDNVAADKRINIGNRLLVYIIKVRDPGFIQDNLAEILAAGKTDRDTGGFNRFRLALIMPEDPVTESSLFTIFNEFKDGDEKIHIHIVAPENEIVKKVVEH